MNEICKIYREFICPVWKVCYRPFSWHSHLVQDCLFRKYPSELFPVSLIVCLFVYSVFTVLIDMCFCWYEMREIPCVRSLGCTVAEPVRVIYPD